MNQDFEVEWIFYQNLIVVRYECPEVGLILQELNKAEE